MVFPQEYATRFDSVNVSDVIFKDNVNFISMFAGEMPKSKMWRYERKKRDHDQLLGLCTAATCRLLTCST
jgi:hypothetical protein